MTRERLEFGRIKPDLTSLRALAEASQFRTVPEFAIVHIHGGELLELVDECERLRHFRTDIFRLFESWARQEDVGGNEQLTELAKVLVGGVRL